MIDKFRSFPRSVQLLLINQLMINLGFYMLMPYLAAYLSGELALATWVVGLLLGVRNFSQQGMFLVGGTLADRFGCKPLIVAGCGLRTVGFALLGAVDSLWVLVLASVATGFAGALFNPAVRAFLAKGAGDRRVEAFALFNMFYQAGILLGPLVGLVLTGLSFRLTCFVAAGVFAVLTVLQLWALPTNPGNRDGATTRQSLWSQWRDVAANRVFLRFAAAMTGSYVLSFQIYLALPLEARRIAGDGLVPTVGIAVLFTASGAVAILGQLRITAWCRARWGAARSMTAGLILMSTAFTPPVAVARLDWAGASTGAVAVGLGLLVVSAAALALATAVVFPFEMDTIVVLAHDRLVATHYGLYNTVCGVGIMLGNLATGVALDGARLAGLPELPWLALLLIGAVCVAAIRRLDSLGLLPEVEGGRDRRTGRHRRRPGTRTLGPAASSRPVGRHRRTRLRVRESSITRSITIPPSADTRARRRVRVEGGSSSLGAVAARGGAVVEASPWPGSAPKASMVHDRPGPAGR